VCALKHPQFGLQRGCRSFAVKRSKAGDAAETDANEGGGKEQVSAKPEVKIEGGEARDT